MSVGPTMGISGMTQAGTARAEDPLRQVIFSTKLAEDVPAESNLRKAIREAL